MKAHIIAVAFQHPEILSPVVAQVVARCQTTSPADPSVLNDVDDVGHCDAG